jgi:DNA-binding Lrp family transcriptional regulator
VWDKERKVVRKISKYIGRIGGDGVFVEASRRIPKLESHKTNNIQNKKLRNKISAGSESQIIKAISMNGRISNKRIGEIMGIRSSSAEAYRKNIEIKYNIRYLATIFPQPLGFTRYAVFVNFLNKKPTLTEMKDALSNEPLVQVGMLSSGKYYLILLILARDNEELNQLINKIKVETRLRYYDSEWYVTPRYVEYGTIPIREEFTKLLREQVWRKTRDYPRPKVGQISYRDFTIIGEVLKEGNVSFSEIDKKYGFENNASRYTYQRLREKKIIHGVTISMQRPGIKYSAVFLITILNGNEFVKYRKQLLEEIIKDLPHLNKYSYICYIENPYGLMFIMSVYEEKDLTQTEEKFLKIKGIKIDTLILTDVFIGSLCFRKYDNDYSSQHKRLVEEFGLPESKLKIKYE